MWHTMRMQFLLKIMKINAHGTPLYRPILLIVLKLAYVFACALSLVTRKICEFGYPGSLWVWVVVKSAIIRPPI
jgi:hypothetical protein